MYCSNGKCYLPQPPRAWSRVQNSCSLITASTVDQFVQVPYTGEIVPYAELGPRLAMINKGNVLQYKKNSSNLTSWQKYSQIAKGQWTNRTKTWATQSTRGYTNPNNLSLIRSGGINITLDGVPTALPVTCPKIPINNNPVLPTNGGGGTSEPPLPPPPPPPSEGGGTVIPIVPVPIVQPIVIQDLGNLVCGSYQNLCTGEIIEPIKLDNCHPTTDSDVPGPIQELCWNDGNPTWYPRQRYIMTNSTNKWPVNAVLGSAVKPSTPFLIADLINCNIVNLSWTFEFECLPITRFNIYQNDEIIANINGTSNSYSIFIDTSGTYSFSIAAENNGIFSDISNTVFINIDPPPAPMNLTINTVCNVATLTWSNTSPCILTYQVYANGSLIAITTNTSYNFILQDDISYTFYIVAFLGSIASDNSNTVTAKYVPYFLTPPLISPTLSYSVSTSTNNRIYTFTSGTGTVTFTSITNVTNGNVTVIGGGGKGGNGGNGDINTGGGGGGGGGSGALNTSVFVPVISTSYNITVGGSTADSIFDSITSNHGGNGGNGQGTPFFSGGSPGSKGIGGTNGVDGQGGGSGDSSGGVGGDGGPALLLSYGKGGNGGYGGDPLFSGQQGASGNNGVVILSIQLSC